MHVVDMEASKADKHIGNTNKRFAAMMQHAPLHTFLFNEHGKLLVANDAAMEACAQYSWPESLPGARCHSQGTV